MFIKDHNIIYMMEIIIKMRKIIVSRYSENVDWLKDYDFDYIIYNKGPKLEGGFNVKDVENIGNNQRDIFQFIVENYDDLPDTMIFVQGTPFDHCNREKFDLVLNNTEFTPLESYGHIPINGSQKLDFDGGYMEINNSWYISAHNQTHSQTCMFSSFDDFMYKTFSNYESSNWNRFTPGSQYLITKKIAKHYPKKFWEYLMNILNKNSMTEGHIIERALLMIFRCKLELRDEFKN